MRLLYLAACTWALSASAPGAQIHGVVVGVTDGDTITLLDEQRVAHKVRLAGIDAPEKHQDFGQRSKQNLSAMAFGRQADVETYKVDRYGRWIGKVVVNGADLNIRQIEAGLAWHYKAYEREQSAADRMTYAAAEEKAKSLGRGLWSIPAPQAPWEFRRGAYRSQMPSPQLQH